MPPLPLPCQLIANNITGLEGIRAGLQAGLAASPPLDRWKARVQIGDLTRQIAGLQRDLDKCQRTNLAPYEAEVVVYDTTNAPLGTRTARLWSMTGDVPTELESNPLVGGSFQFATDPAGAPIGITIEETGNPAVQGVDFRSGSLEELPRNAPEDPSGRIEIVVGPTLTFTSEELTGWLDTVAVPISTSTDLPPPTGGRADITVSSVSVKLVPGAIDITAVGTANVSGAMWGSQLAPFKLELPVSLGLPHTPDSAYGCDVLLQGSPSLTVGGALGSVLTMIAQTLVDFVGGQSLPIFRKAINRALPEAVAAIYGLGKPPRNSVVSLRRFEITPAAVVIEPTISAFGDVLSTFMA
jgi:hypothetical protein